MIQYEELIPIARDCMNEATALRESPFKLITRIKPLYQKLSVPLKKFNQG